MCAYIEENYAPKCRRIDLDPQTLKTKTMDEFHGNYNELYIVERERELHSFNVSFQIYDPGWKNPLESSFSNILAAV